MNSAQTASPYIQSKMSWSVAFDGRKLGTIQTTDPGFTTPYSWTYTRDRLLNVQSSDLAPSVANKSGLFSGWCQKPAVRPLIVVSGGQVDDPETWRPTTVSVDDLARLFDDFRRNAGVAYICANLLESGVPFEYGLQDLEAVKGYKNNSDRRLITMRLKKGSNCDGPIDKSWDRHSFLTTKSSIAYLGVGLELVDAGDYDGDGASELIFWFSGYNHDGYMLYSKDSPGLIPFTWKYH